MFKYYFMISVWLVSLSSLWGNPQNPTVVSGVINPNPPVVSNGTTLDIVLGSPNTVIEWGSFSISAGETTRFSTTITNQPSYVLNTVTGSTPSNIMGNLFTQHGQNINVYLVNPNGIVIGPTGVVVTNGNFLASSLPLVGSFKPNEPMHFVGTDTSVGVRNSGSVTSLNGDVIFLGFRIHDTATGVINAPAGTAAFGAGLNLLYKPNDGSQRIFIQSSQPAGNSGVGIQFDGTVTAMSVLMIADCNPYALAINVKGTINVTGCTMGSGKVKLITECPNVTCTTNGVIQISGTINRDVTTGFGSEIDIIGSNILLLSTAVLNVQGDLGGGVVNIGSSTIPCPTAHVCIDKGAQILANALVSGNGGNVKVYASLSLLFLGNINVSGAGTNGNGGTVVLNSPGYLGIDGTVNLSGSGTGANGTLTAITSAITIGGDPNYGTGCLDGVFGCLCTTTSPGSIFTQTSLQSILHTGNVIVNALGTYVPGIINIVKPITWDACNSLTLLATNQINFFALLKQTTVGTSSKVVVSLTAPTINVGVPAQNLTAPVGVDISCGNIFAHADLELNIWGQNGAGNFGELVARHGSVTVEFGEVLLLLAGDKGADAKIVGAGTDTVNIDALHHGQGVVIVEASNCASAFIDSPFVNVGVNTPINNFRIIGGNTGSGNIAYVGSITDGSTITMNMVGDLSLTGGPNGSNNTASIISVDGYQQSTTITANNISILAGTTGTGNTAGIFSLGDLGSIKLTVGNDMFITGGKLGSISNSAIVQATTVQATVLRDLFITGGGGLLDIAQIYGTSGVNLIVSRNLTVFGGTRNSAVAEIRSHNGNIVINSISGASTFTFRASNVGVDNAPARLYITGNGSILIGSTVPPSFVEFIAGDTGNEPAAQAFIGGNGNIEITSLNDIMLLGGGFGLTPNSDTNAEFFISKAGFIKIFSGRDLILTAGVGFPFTSNAGAATTNGHVTVTAVRDVLLTGNCNPRHDAYLTANGNMTVTTGRDLLLRDFPAAHIDSTGNASFNIGRFETIIGCNGLPPTPPSPPSPPSPPCPPPCPAPPCVPFIPLPGYQWYKYNFLYELFYRLRYFGPIDFYELHDYFWDTTDYTSP